MLNKFEKGIMWVRIDRQRIPQVCRTYKGFSIMRNGKQWLVIHNVSSLAVNSNRDRKYAEKLCIFLADNYEETWDGKFTSWIDINEGFQMGMHHLITKFNREDLWR
jgi:hypothetical protein